MNGYCIVGVCYFSSTLSEDKRRLENKISSLEEDLEEEQQNNEQSLDRIRRAHQQVRCVYVL